MEALLERGNELQELQEALGAARDGTGHVVVIEGPAGIGKSALLGLACDSARESGLRVLSARGSEFGRMYRWGIVRSLFAPALAVPEAERAHVFNDAAALADVPQAVKRGAQPRTVSERRAMPSRASSGSNPLKAARVREVASMRRDRGPRIVAPATKFRGPVQEIRRETRAYGPNFAQGPHPVERRVPRLRRC